ncbi:Putative beta-ribofuranosylaminobenzene 5'-phosphate synthase. Involved in methanopterin biosynthesis (orf4) [Candidatus Methylomirabilis oxygeniifera]|uniref:Putative beta-ribofuranosylaminobenzene 5'-phosphate synthase. Involved in methanopterin biosynthesis (Orf4) n=1 Tax=Methylomirabilis oxygeniifera TaxID=671143 RepID=D5MJW3_METO1|nr:Putative beta-ribofuranosylaminobenzene 5'-phosphate synthase. Involved in methanopterin biosynthesis (orf4) [Candidatus Methylomirabilis oxyfera]
MKVTVKAHARLHFGFIDPDGSSGRQFGSIGLAIDEPSIMLEAMPANRLSVTGTERDRVLALARQFLSHYNIRQTVHISVKTTIPAHIGLGSGTQLALSVAAALARLFSVDADVRELAGVMGRGRRSGIGIAAFERGGFIVDAGRRAVQGGGWRVEGVPPMIARYPFPKDWTFVVAIPRAGRGLAGAQEVRAFHRIAGRPADTGRLSRILLMQMLPSVLERDPVVFGKSLTMIQRIVGHWFQPVQGGTFATTQGATLAKAMSQAGALGVGQSSWGPAVYGLAKDLEMATSIMEKMREVVPTKVHADVFPAKAFNRGAEIR